MTSTAGPGATGTLSLNGGNIAIVRGAGFGAGQYTLIQFDGPLIGAVGNLTLNPLGGGFQGNLALGAGTVLLNVAASADNVWWNGSTLAATGSVVGGSGTWNLTNGNFANAAGTQAGPWAGNGALAVFGGTTAGTVTIAAGASVAPSGINFLTNGYVIAGGDAASRLSLTGPTGIQTAAGVNATISAVMSGAGSLTKTGTGTLTLSGGNSFTGLTTVSAGTLVNTGTLAGAVLNQAVFTSTGSVLGGVTNGSGTGTANLAGVVQGGISNSGLLNFTGNTAASGTLNKSASGRLVVDAGAAVTGLGGVLNFGGAPDAFTINGSLSTSGQFINQADARLEIAAGGSLSAVTGVQNSSGAVITNAGTITSQVINAGTLNSTGTLGGTLANQTGSVANLSGTASTIINSGTLTFTGNTNLTGSVTNTASGRVTVAQGQTVTSSSFILQESSATGSFVINGRLTTTTVLQVSANGQLQIAATGSVQTGTELTSLAGSTITNAGQIAGQLRVLGLLVSTGSILDGMTLNPGGEARIAGVLNGAVNTPGLLTITGNTTSNGSVVSTGTTGQIIVNAGATWSGVGFVNLNGSQPESLLVNGTLSLAAGQRIAVGDGTSARVAAGGTFTTTAPLTAIGLSVGNLGSFVNQGTVNAYLVNNGAVTNAGTWTGSAEINAPAVLTNTGTWDASGTGGFMRVSGRVDNSGTVRGALTITRAGPATGLFVNLAAGVVNTGAVAAAITNDGTIQNAGSWTGAINIGGGGLLGNGTLANSGTINGLVTNSVGSTLTSTGSLLAGLVNGGTASLAGTVAGAIGNTGTLTFTGNTGHTGTLTNSAAGTVTVNAGVSISSTLAGSGTGLVTNNGNWTGNATTSGLLTNAATGVWNGNLTAQAGANIQNLGQLNGTLNIQSGGTASSSGTITGLVTNQGTFTSTGTLGAGLDNARTATLAGTVNGVVVNSGTITLSGVTSGIGSFTQTTAGTLSLNGFNTSIGSLAGAGALNLGTATLTMGGSNASTAFSGVFSGTGSLVKTGTGTLTLSGQSFATIAATVAQGTLVYERPGAAGIGGTTVQDGATLLLQANVVSNFTAGQLSLAGTGVGGLGALRARVVDEQGGVTSSYQGIFLAADSLISVETGRIILSGITGTGRTLSVNIATSAILTGLATGTGGLIKTGAGSLTLTGPNSFTGDTNVQAGSLTVTSIAALAGRVVNGATVTNEGQINGAVINTGRFTNRGQALGGVTNNAGATFTSTGTVQGGLISTGTANLAGTARGAINNTGSMNITGNLISDGALVNSGTGRVRVLAGANWTGLTGFTNSSTNASGLSIDGTLSIAGLLTNAAGSLIAVNADGTLNAANVGNAADGLILVYAGGTVNDTLTNNGDVFNFGRYNADLNNSGAVAFIVNQVGGVWDGDVLSNSADGTVVNSGQWIGDVLSNAATIANINGAVWTGNVTNGAGGFVLNEGQWTGDIANSGLLLVAATGQWTGAIVNQGAGNLLNEGRINGTLTVTGGIADNRGVIDGAVVNAATLASTGTLTSGLTNSGAAALSGTVSGAIANTGVLTVDGTLASTGALSNIGSGTVQVLAGGNWTGLTGITNGSTAPTGIIVAGRLITAGVIANGAGATFLVQSGGRVEAAGVTNAATGTIIVQAGGTVIDDLDNSGGVANAGNYTANVNNTGAAASLTNEATGIWTGNLLGNTGNAIVVNRGSWTGSASTAARLLNAAGATWTGALTTQTGSQTDNAGTWAGTVSNAGLFQNLAGGTVSGAVTNSGTLVNAATLAAGLINTGTAATSGTIAGGLVNSGTMTAQGTINGAINNQGAGSLSVTGALAGNSTLANTGSAQLLLTGGSFTGLTAVTNSSTNATGIGVANGRTLAAVTVSNAAGATLVNQGTLTTTGGTTNSGTLATSGTLNGALTNQASGQVQAQGAVNGPVTNAGSFLVLAALSSNGGSFSNGATGQLVNLGSVYGGLGAISNAAGGRIFLGNGTTNATLSGVSMTNAGAIEMMNVRVGDQVILSGTYTGVAGSRVSLDVNMAQNTSLSDRITAAGFSGTTTVSLQNIGPSRIYFANPIMLATGAGAGATFAAATDAATQAALSSNGIVDYALRELPGGGLALVSSVNTARASAIGADTQAFTNLADFGLSISAEALAAGAPANGQWSARLWGRVSSARQDVTSVNATSDPFGTGGEIESALISSGFRVGGSIRLLAGPAGNLDVGASGGRSEGKSTQALSGQVTRFEMPVYGVHAVFTGSWLRADLRHDVLDLQIDPANLVSGSTLSGDGTRTSFGLGLPVAIENGWIEPYLRAERTRVSIDATNLSGGLGTLSFDTQQLDRTALGLATRVSIPGQTWTVRPSLDVSVNWEDGSASNRFTAAGGTGSVLIGTPRDDTYLDAEIGLSMTHNASGLELFVQGTGRAGGSVQGQAVVVGARIQF